MPSRIAARSRGPPRPITRRARARARSGNDLQPLAQIGAQRSVVDKRGDGVEALRDRARIGQRSGEPLRQGPRAGRRDRAVDGSEERAAPLAGKGADELEIAARRRVDRERRALRLAHRRRERRALAELRALDIGDHRGRRGELDTRERAEGRGGGDGEEFGKPALGGRAVEHIAGERHHCRQRPQHRRQLRIRVKRVGDDHLARLEAGDLGGKRGAVAFGDAKFAGRNIDPGEREAIVGRGGATARQRHEVVVAPGVEKQILGQRARRHQPHDVAADDALVAALSRLGGIFELLADRDAVTERDQAMQIFVGALDRNAAHRNVAAQMLAAFGEHNAERTRGDLRVIEEQFVEIAHPVKQEAVRIGGLDLDILLHHRGDRRPARDRSVFRVFAAARQHDPPRLSAHRGCS